MTKQLIADIEKKIICPKEDDCLECLTLRATLKGIYLGAISELKDEFIYWKIKRKRKGHVDDNSNGIKDRISQITSEIKQYEDKLKELEE